ncbi:MAG TPA: hypothetical protein DHT43_01570 [Deltaproteobacteria bacterium]|nr:hypothetical protein [Deltaproteobacteria bacterium]
MENLATIAAVAGIIGTLIAILVVFKTKQIFSPKLSFNIGLSRTISSKKGSKLLKSKKQLNTIVYAGIPKDSNKILTYCAYLIENKGKQPITNIRLHIEYLSKFALPNDFFLNEFGQEIIDQGIKSNNWLENREVSLMGPISQISIRHDIIRPGEKVVLFDIMDFTEDLDAVMSNIQSIGDLGLKALYKRIYKTSELNNFCVLDIFLLSSEKNPFRKKVNILWFKSKSRTKINELLRICADGFWSGQYPSTGFYPIMPWVKFLRKELFEIVVPSFQQYKKISIVDPFHSEIGLGDIIYPGSNYYNAPDVLSSKELTKFFLGLTKFDQKRVKQVNGYGTLEE